VRTLLFLVRKEFTQIFRDRTMLRMLIVMPIVQLLVLSSAATFEVREAAVYLVDQDGSATSRGLAQRLVASGRFVVAERSVSMEQADEALLDRRVKVILRIPADFERQLVRTRTAPVQLVLNAEDGAGAGVIQSYLTRILSDYGVELGRTLQPGVRTVRSPDAPPPAQREVSIRASHRGWYNPQLEYTDYMVPGILVLLVTIVSTAVASMNIVREKEIGTLEQLNVTPLTRTHFIAGKLTPFWIIALVDMALGLLVAHLVFDVPMRGSLVLVFAATLVYLFVALGIGLWISTVVETQQQAMFLTFAVNMVYLLMSGLFTPIASMPVWAQWVAQLSPVKHFIVIMRSVLVKGAGFAEIQLPLYVLAVYGTLVLALAVRQHSRTSAA
jgi:ABC-2 type transport system permease protein